MSVAKQYEFRKTQCLGIFKKKDDERPIIAFGLKKAVAVLDHIDEIKSFVTSQSSSKPEETDGSKPKGIKP